MWSVCGKLKMKRWRRVLYWHLMEKHWKARLDTDAFQAK